MRISFYFWSLKVIVCDLALLYVCGVMAGWLRGYALGLENFTPAGLCLVAVTCFMALSVVGAYDVRTNMCTLRYASEHALAMGAALVAAFTLTYVFSTYHSEIKPGRSVLLMALVFFTVGSWAYRYFIALRRMHEAAGRFFYIAGGPELAGELAPVCEEARFPYQLRPLPLDGEGLRRLDALLNERDGQCEGIVVDVTRRTVKTGVRNLLFQINLHAVPVYPLEAFIETYFHKIVLSEVNLTLALNGTFKADHHSAYGNIKGLIDLLVSTVLFVLLLPLILICALAIHLEDGGPALYTQQRMGRFERPFTIYKLRTMRVAPAGTESDYTAKEDDRITRVGKFLRLTRLDELPQLWNVILGDMSLIGPRAEWCKLVEQYEREIPLYHLRHMVKPGITGWAQVNYGYGASLRDTEEKLQYDLYYLKHYSAQMDAAIALKTLFTVLSAVGR